MGTRTTARTTVAAGVALLGAAALVAATAAPSGAADGDWREATTSQVNGEDFFPVAGDFDGDGDDDLLFYESGPGTDYLRPSNGDGTFGAGTPLTVNGDYVPLVGDLAPPFGVDDVLWVPLEGTAYLWAFDGAGGYRSLAVPLPLPGTQPLLLDHSRVTGGTDLDQVLWYRPGPGGERLDSFRGAAGVLVRVATGVGSVNGSYLPGTGDWDGDGVVDVFWHAPGATADYVWRKQGAGQSDGFVSEARSIQGTFGVGSGRFVDPAAPGDDLFLDGEPVAYLWPDASPADQRPVFPLFDRTVYVDTVREDPAGSRADVALGARRDSAAGEVDWVVYGVSQQLPVLAELGDVARYPVVGDFLGSGRDSVYLYGLFSASDRTEGLWTRD